MVQQHLTYKDMTNNGCFYTPEKYADFLVKKLKNIVPNLKDYVLLDSSCGYGVYFDYLRDKTKKLIGADIDIEAIEIAKHRNPNVEYIHTNSVYQVDRAKFGVRNNENLIIIGNPPYNDTTSFIKNGIKKDAEKTPIDKDIKLNDLGRSFMLSFAKLNPEYVAVLHPLSYLVKEANFKSLKNFYGRYKLIYGLVVNSQSFQQTSKSAGFPIIIAIYKHDLSGMNYDNVKNFKFRTEDNKVFNINGFDYINNYINKYPQKNYQPKETDCMFFTMRDINALRRSRTFINEKTTNTVYVDKDKFSLYCYVDTFKDYLKHVPYYLGNFNLMIDYNKFKQIENEFIKYSVQKHQFLHNKFKIRELPNLKLIEDYIKNLLGEYYVY